MFGIHSGGKIGGKVIAVADVGGDSAGVAIIHVLPGEPAAILASERLSLPFGERTPEQATSGALSLLDEACKKVLEKYAGAYAGRRARPVVSAYAIIHSHWTSSKTLQANEVFPTEERITDSVIEKLARSALGKEGQLDRSKLIEASVISIELNGYKTRNISGKRAHEVQISALVSGFEPPVRTGITETLQRNFSVSSPILRSEMHALFSVLNESAPQSLDRVIIEMGSDSTNCIVIHEDAAMENILVAEGTNTILRRISASAPAEETLSLMRMIARDACESDACQKLSAALASIEPELARIFGEAMGRLASSRHLPNPLTIIVRAEFAPWLCLFFSRVDFGQFTITTRPFSPLALAPGDLGRIAETQENAVVDTSLALAASFVNIEELQE